MTILVTGAAGFIGFHVARALLAGGRAVVGLDNLNSYYDVGLKQARLLRLASFDNFRFFKADLADEAALDAVFADGGIRTVVNLAAQVGVRNSVDNPRDHVRSNLDGFVNVLEACRHHAVAHLIYASSSSVYGLNARMPLSVRQPVEHPVSLYGATKKANELFAHSYSHLFGLPTTGLRFFTVYGPWGRPDMAAFAFTRAILAGEPIRVFNEGNVRRDFTYIDDVVAAILPLLDRPAVPASEWHGEAPQPGLSSAPYRVYNVGNRKPESVLRLIELLEGCLGRRALVEMCPMQPGDMEQTCADTDDLQRDVGFVPKTSLEAGIPKFVDWYRSFYGD
jgi:UDP-glucuronate 4-epimerase